MSDGELVYVVKKRVDGMRKYLNQCPSDWPDWVDASRFAYRFGTYEYAQEIAEEHDGLVIPLRVRTVQRERCETCGRMKRGKA